MNKIMLMAVAGLCLPVLSYAATYSYVSVTGDIQTVEAPTAEAALDASAYNRAPTSGVVVATQAEARGDMDGDGTILYQYVSVSGSVEEIEAMSPAEAIANAENRVFDSGVVNSEINPIPDSITVNVSTQNHVAASI